MPLFIKVVPNLGTVYCSMKNTLTKLKDGY
ncbi:MAG: hypothetical protein ACI9VT_004046 [Psychroserpens sp.]|jgi:hypothetical protein